MGEFDLEVKIGLEIHVQLTHLKTKLFCGCSTDYRGKEPNTNLCPVCMGLPGSLPVLNENAVKDATALAFALNSTVQPHMLFFRKNYYYPDMPKNFQITQYDKAGGVPFSVGGTVTMEGQHEIRITRLQLEEDPARLAYEGTIDQSTATLVDYNRAGMSLIEIVTEPDFRAPKEARNFLDKLRSIVESLGISDGSLEGAMRCDANISLKGGIRVEVKNISSFKEVERALNFEISRQKSLVAKGIKVKRETRHWDEARRITVSLRTKEEEQDYRYFPEPDLVPVALSKPFLTAVKAHMPELPQELGKRLEKQYGMSTENAKILADHGDFARYFEQCTRLYPDAVEISNWIVSDLIPDLAKRERGLHEAKMPPETFCSLLKLLKDGAINRVAAKTVLEEALDTGKAPEAIVKAKKLSKIGDESVIEDIVSKIFAENPVAVESALKDPKAANYLVGLVMKATKGQADPQLANQVIRKKLQSA
ncbi:MAG: Asp-tRNA(Asn)/Glu-tRNA(Gln) amidotransferase subunit GatB [Candidatus Bathyarchaeota archaeon]|nr:Asp-tRNA(Asn)/Glu-tRNA(Gln) amidotransferase subunit GatB [Candidatus Bathyarchaeota archaeon]